MPDTSTGHERELGIELSTPVFSLPQTINHAAEKWKLNLGIAIVCQGQPKGTSFDEKCTNTNSIDSSLLIEQNMHALWVTSSWWVGRQQMLGDEQS